MVAEWASMTRLTMARPRPDPVTFQSARKMRSKIFSQPRQQLFHHKRFGTVIVTADFQAGNTVGQGITRGQNENRNRLALIAPGLQKIDAIAVEQAQIEHARIIFRCGNRGNRFVRELKPVHCEVRFFQRFTNCIARFLIIFEKQYPHAKSLPSKGRKRRFLCEQSIVGQIR